MMAIENTGRWNLIRGTQELPFGSRRHPVLPRYSRFARGVAIETEKCYQNQLSPRYSYCRVDGKQIWIKDLLFSFLNYDVRQG